MGDQADMGCTLVTQTDPLTAAMLRGQRDKALDDLDRLEGEHDHLCNVVATFLARLDRGDVRVDEQIRAMREALDR